MAIDVAGYTLVDCATRMNKGASVVEASGLFRVLPGKCDIARPDPGLSDPGLTGSPIPALSAAFKILSGRKNRSRTW
jgi:hypothetical protein